MATTDEILQAAKKVGDLIGKHETARKLDAVLAKLKEDAEAQRALNDYTRHLQNISEKESAGKPIEVDDKRQLEKLQTAVVRNELLRDFQVVQMDYVDLMRRVDEAIQGQAPGRDAAGATSPEAASSPLVNPDLSDLR